MKRTFVTQRQWERPLVAGHDSMAHKRATLRVSALVGAAVLAAAMLPGLEIRSDVTAPAPALRMSPEIVLVAAKSNERVMAEAPPVFGDITSSATLRHARIPTADIGDVMHGRLVAPQSMRQQLARTEPVREAEALEPHTLRHDGRVLRLAGIEAPHADEMCRRLDGLMVSCIDRALSYMNLLIKGRRLNCDDAPGVRTESDGPPQAVCRAGEADVAEAMVRQGWARANDKPEERFMLAQSAARKQKLGLWR
jgi:endonuclease YncB( thermonuclease family)